MSEREELWAGSGQSIAAVLLCHLCPGMDKRQTLYASVIPAVNWDTGDRETKDTECSSFPAVV